VLVALSAIAALLAVAYTKAFSGTGLTPVMEVPPGGNALLYRFSLFGPAALLLVAPIHLLLKPGTAMRVGLAVALLAYVVALLGAARRAVRSG
jgi:hypothetical protein